MADHTLGVLLSQTNTALDEIIDMLEESPNHEAGMKQLHPFSRKKLYNLCLKCSEIHKMSKDIKKIGKTLDLYGKFTTKGSHSNQSQDSDLDLQ